MSAPSSTSGSALDLPLFDPARRQREAYTRGASIWVEASAGTGKTTVLTRRVLSLLLNKTSPSRILCLTFTKAAAAEMANRINKTLSEWATIEDGKLAQALEEIGARPDADLLDYARQLFARVLDAPGGITIATIHAFCQSLLRRFPLEAGVAPYFELMDDRSSAEALTAAREAVLTRARNRTDLLLSNALAEAVSRTHEASFIELLSSIAQERARLTAALSRGFDAFETTLRRMLGLKPGETPEGIVTEACRDKACDETGLRAAAQAMLASKNKRDNDRGSLIAAWLSEVDAREFGFDAYLHAFFTEKGPRFNPIITKALANERADVVACVEAEAERLETIRRRRCAAALFAATTAIARLGAAMLDEYARHKEARALLDYDDLILKTRDLLLRPGIAPWVLFKLDGGLDHILVDEAQDTNPEQWEIIRLLAEEFFAGEGAQERESGRTVFAVGDAKQSIYSFQRADPAKFVDMRGHFESKAGDAWRKVPLDLSFRSVAAVLDAVDAVFATGTASDGVALDGHTIKHIARRAGDAGLVELWPPVMPEPVAPLPAWQPPTEQHAPSEPQARLAEAIAARVQYWLENNEKLEGHDRPIRARDVMVLVRRRGPFVAELVRALKRREVPVAGVDRMMLTDQLAVEDMLALAQFLLLPQDDLTLATVLKGPLFGLSEEELYALAYQRKAPLWDVLRDRREEAANFTRAVDELSRLLAQVDFVPPYELFAGVLSARRGRYAMLSRLGSEASDPLDELLAATLAYERVHGVSLQGFLHWLSVGAPEIKRDLDQGARDEVRILTVHGAKGLEAPIVFLPDTLQMPMKTQPLLWDEDGLPLWMASREALPRMPEAMLDAAKRKRDQEYRRLLYVAMTRAADRLYICGWQGRRGAPAGNWHALVAAGLETAGATSFDFATETFPGMTAWPGKGLRLQQAQTGRPSAARPAQNQPAPHAMLPDWCWHDPVPEPAPPKPLAPSQPTAQEPPARSPLGDDRGAAFLRGRLVHRLLQSLPGIEAVQRAGAGRRFLALPVHGLPPAEQEAILAETLTVLSHPDFASIFGSASVAEVPVVGLVGGRALSGQIDRLVVEGDTVLIVDYKTVRPVPPSLESVPPLYFNQLAAYRAAIAAVFPGKDVRCALLWTDGPLLMPVPPEKLNGFGD